MGISLFGTTIFAGTTPAISSAQAETTIASNKIVVFFNFPVWGNANPSSAYDYEFDTALSKDNFIFTDVNGAGMASISSVTHTAGQNYAILTMNTNAVAGDISNDTLSAKANSIFTVGGALSEKTVTLSEDSGAPTITADYSKVDADGTYDKLVIGFSEPVFSSTSFDPVDENNLTYNDLGGAGVAAMSSATASADNRYVFVTAAAGFDTDNTDDDDTVTVQTGEIMDAHGNAMTTGTAEINTNDDSAPQLSDIQGVIGDDKILMTFSLPVFDTATCSGAVETGDFTYNEPGGSAGATALSSVTHTGGDSYALFDLNANLVALDLTAPDQLLLGFGSLKSCVGSNVIQIDTDFDDTIDPVILKVRKFRSGINNAIEITYSEGVIRSPLTSASTSATSSSGTAGDMTAACDLDGFGTFASGGLTYTTGTNLLSNDSTQSVVTAVLAGSGGSRTSSSDTDCSGTFTPETVGAAYDLHVATNSIEGTSIISTITESDSWITGTASQSDTTGPAVPTTITAEVNEDNNIALYWTDPTDSDLSTIRIYRGVGNLPVDGGNPVGNVNAGVQHFVDTDVENNETYSYVLKGFDSSGNAGVASDVISIDLIIFAANTAADDGSSATDVAPENDESEAEATVQDQNQNETPTVARSYDEEKEIVMAAAIVTINIDQAANKCEALQMIANVLEWPLDQSVTDDGFADTPEWCAPVALYARENGVVQGRSDSILGMNSPVSRYEVAAMLANSLGYTKAAGDYPAATDPESYFADHGRYADHQEILEQAPWAVGPVYRLRDEGLMTGYPDGTFSGSQSVLKIELAVAFWRTLAIPTAPSF